MSVPGNIEIRHFLAADRQAVRAIACDTAFLEAGRRNFIDDSELLADALTKYFTDYEPESCFVAVAEGKVIGYLIGARDVRRMNAVSNVKIFPMLCAKALVRGAFFKPASAVFFANVIKSFFKGEFSSFDFSNRYPAILHINIDEDFRSRGIGSRLIGRYRDYLRAHKVRGVHFGTMSEKAKDFFCANGFVVLYAGTRSYLRYYLHRESPYYILGEEYGYV